MPTRRETRVLEVPEGSKVDDVARALGLLPDGWIAVRDNRPLPSDDPVKDGDELRLVSVVSGG